MAELLFVLLWYEVVALIRSCSSSRIRPPPSAPVVQPPAAFRVPFRLLAAQTNIFDTLYVILVCVGLGCVLNCVV